jgi:hypothetical protein
MFTRLRHLHTQLRFPLGATGLPVPLQPGSYNQVSEKNNLREVVHPIRPAEQKSIYVESRSNCLSASYRQRKHWQASGTQNLGQPCWENN